MYIQILDLFLATHKPRTSLWRSRIGASRRQHNQEETALNSTTTCYAQNTLLAAIFFMPILLTRWYSLF